MQDVSNEIKRMRKPRIWEIDFLRGFLILFVIFDHFWYDVSALGSGFVSSFGRWLYAASESYYTTGTGATVFGALRELTRYSFVMLFVAISGVSSQFSKNNLKRGLLLSGAGIGFTLITVLLPKLGLTGVMPIRFNVIHVIAVCVLFYSLLEWIYAHCHRDWAKNMFFACTTILVVFALIAGYYYLERYYDGSLFGGLFFQPMLKLEQRISPGDYLSLFPALGWFLIGAFLGKRIYAEKRTLFPSVKAEYLRPITFIGRHSIWFYFGSQIVMYSLLWLFGAIGVL